MSINTYVPLRKPADSLAHGPHSHLCALFGNTQLASALQFLRGAFFSLKTPLNQECTGHLPQTYVLLSGWLQC